ncbi:hypothetical protein BKA70DRAFT_1121247 [Coprinopsis sp. MPI-PUGE-AT-0042]|nr:hypothetical protein BKA70DRAFT_1121247 [Coprinopsis sp. MPI-PUGE-AT-0042]
MFEVVRKTLDKFVEAKTPTPGPNLAHRKIIAQDTVSRATKVISEHSTQAATADSSFVSGQLPALDESKNPKFPSSGVDVVNSDAFAAARRLAASIPDSKGKISVLNLASDQRPGGGWLYSLSKTQATLITLRQEEALCYSSTLYVTLKEEYYPWPNVGPGSAAGVYSPGVVIFKDDLDHACLDLPTDQRLVVSVITVAAPRYRKLTPDGEQFNDPSVLEDLRAKIRLVYRMAAQNGQQYLILGAMGCGAYACPPKLVAEEMKSILLEKEFSGWFGKAVFAVYSTPSDGPTNFSVFSETFKGVTLGEV